MTGFTPPAPPVFVPALSAGRELAVPWRRIRRSPRRWRWGRPWLRQPQRIEFGVVEQDGFDLRNLAEAEDRLPRQNPARDRTLRRRTILFPSNTRTGPPRPRLPVVCAIRRDQSRDRARDRHRGHPASWVHRGQGIRYSRSRRHRQCHPLRAVRPSWWTEMRGPLSSMRVEDRAGRGRVRAGARPIDAHTTYSQVGSAMACHRSGGRAPTSIRTCSAPSTPAPGVEHRRCQGPKVQSSGVFSRSQELHSRVSVRVRYRVFSFPSA